MCPDTLSGRPDDSRAPGRRLDRGPVGEVTRRRTPSRRGHLGDPGRPQDRQACEYERPWTKAQLSGPGGAVRGADVRSELQVLGGGGAGEPPSVLSLAIIGHTNKRAHTSLQASRLFTPFYFLCVVPVDGLRRRGCSVGGDEDAAVFLNVSCTLAKRRSPHQSCLSRRRAVSLERRPKSLHGGRVGERRRPQLGDLGPAGSAQELAGRPVQAAKNRAWSPSSARVCAARVRPAATYLEPVADVCPGQVFNSDHLFSSVHCVRREGARMAIAAETKARQGHETKAPRVCACHVQYAPRRHGWWPGRCRTTTSTDGLATANAGSSVATKSLGLRAGGVRPERTRRDPD